MNIGYKAVSYATVGGYHMMMNMPCQDSVCIKRKDSIFVAALADGAGSVTKSEIISLAIVEKICDLFIAQFHELYNLREDELSVKISEEAENIVLQQLESMKADCTLLLFASDGENKLFVHCGDGIIFGNRENGDGIISLPENGETLSQTFFLSTKNPKQHIRIYKDIDPAYTSFLLCSDGLEPILFNRICCEPAKATVNMMNWITIGSEAEAQEMLTNAMEGILKQHTTDDISAILIGEETNNVR